MSNYKHSLLASFVVALLFVATSCNRASAEPTAGPAPTVEPGDSEHELKVDELPRTFLLHIPPGLNRQDPVPVLFVFHGRPGTAADMKEGTPFDAIADRAGFVVVYPQGVRFHWNVRRPGEGSANDPNLPEVDEAAFIEAMMSELGAIVDVDSRRVYAMGFSQGGSLVYQLACNMSDRFAAVASLAGPMERIPCEPSQPVSVVHAHGLADIAVPFTGGGPVDVPPAEEGLATWRRLNQCTGSPKIEEFAETVTHTAYSGCEDGTAVELYTIEGLGHRAPREFSFGATVWDFFAAHPKP